MERLRNKLDYFHSTVVIVQNFSGRKERRPSAAAACITGLLSLGDTRDIFVLFNKPTPQ